MKREDLKKANLSDEQVEAVMKLYGQDQTKLNDYDKLKTQLDSSNQEKETLSSQLKDIKGQLDIAVKDKSNSDELKTQLATLQGKLKESSEQAEKQLSAFKKNSAVEVGLLKAGAKNTKAVKAGLDLDKISFDDKGNLVGLNDQIETLKKDEAWSPLFPSEKQAGSIKNEHATVTDPNDKEAQDAALKKAFSSSNPFNGIKILNK